MAWADSIPEGDNEKQKKRSDSDDGFAVKETVQECR